MPGGVSVVAAVATAVASVVDAGGEEVAEGFAVASGAVVGELAGVGETGADSAVGDA